MASAILLSGGIDSTALVHWKRSDVGIALTMDYGQVCAKAEIDAAAEVCAVLGLRHEIIRLDCRPLGSGSLARSPNLANAPTPEWWPFRNQFLITIAAMRAIREEVSEILIGTVHGDSKHADGRLQFVELMDDVLHMQEGMLRLAAPALAMTSVELVATSGVPRTLLSWAHSCHRSDHPCGDCRGCYKHEAVMRELGWLT